MNPAGRGAAPGRAEPVPGVRPVRQGRSEGCEVIYGYEEAVAEASSRFERLGPLEQRARLAAILMRIWVLASPAFDRWPQLREPFEQALFTSCQPSRPHLGQTPSELSERLDFDVESDGSPEWEHLVDLAGLLMDSLDGVGVEQVYLRAMTTHLDTTYGILGNELVAGASRADMHRELRAEVRWLDAISAVTG